MIFKSSQLDGKSLERFRAYLSVLAEVELDPRFHRKVAPSDIVQETLLKGHQAADQLRGKSTAEVAAWLRRILARTISNALRDLRCARRDFRRERPLEASLKNSSIRLQVLMASEASPTKKIERQEILFRVTQALGTLPKDQREALLLQHWNGWPLAKIASHMNRSRSAIAGLLRRALENLRKDLQDLR